MIGIIGGSINVEKEGIVSINRHEGNTPPHRIDHKKNILALKEKGVDTVIGVCSVGSLKEEIGPGSIVIPSDYINFDTFTIFHDEINHTVPELDEELRQKLIQAAEKAGFEHLDEAIYIQTKGPRFETKSEIKVLQKWGGDIVGMTMASEATAAKEAGLKYAALCSVDNFANGVSEEALSEEEWRKSSQENKEKIKKILEVL